MLPLKLVQRRIANISVGASTVRGQPKGTVNIARNYLKSLNLQEFSQSTDEEEFKTLLNKHTQVLKEKLPSKSWGIARKVLNIFLFQATHDILIYKYWSLNRIIPHLELTLDGPNAMRLKKFAKKEGIKLHWDNIYSLKPEVNEEFQAYAKRCAISECNCEKCYLDIYWWRSEE